MRKEMILSLAMLALAVDANAEKLSPEQALDRALATLPAATRSAATAGHGLVRTYSASDGMPAVYVFNKADDAGYLLVSADDVAVPLLGYADRGNFSKNELPPQLEWWIGEYSRQIRYAADNSLPAATMRTRSGREEVKPILTTAWDQENPYNQYTPVVNGQHTPTGCVATAMAQIMKRWNYPQVGQGSATIMLPDSTTDVLAFRNVQFDWENMLGRYTAGGYSEAQAAAVADLMKACGYAVNMKYAPEGSGASPINAARALVNNFKYNSSIQFFSRNFVGATAWDDIIYNEISAGRPVLYGGASASVGHEFVCDGYDGKGYYHFNWGWGGMSDGYFLLDALNPTSLGTGGGTGGGFNYGQDIIVGIQPDKGEAPRPQLTQMGPIEGAVAGNTVNLTCGKNNGWFNTGLSQITVDVGVEIAPAETESSSKTKAADPIYVTVFSKRVINGPVPPEDYMSGIGPDMDVKMPDGLADGRYRMTVCYRASDSEGSQWMPVQTVSYAYNYVYVVKSGNRYAVENPGEALLQLADAELLSPLYYGSACKFRITVANKSEKELTQSFSPALLIGKSEQMTGDGITLTLQPGDTVSREFTTMFELSEGAEAPASTMVYDLIFFDFDLGYDYELMKCVTMEPEAPAPELSITGLKVPGKTQEALKLSVKEGSVMGYVVNDRNDIRFSATVTCKSGFYASPVYLVIFPEEIYTPQGSSNVTMTEMTPVAVLSAGESVSVEAVLNFPEAGTQVYTAVPYIVKDGQLTDVNNVSCAFKVVTSADVDMTGADVSGMAIDYDASARILRASGASRVGVYSLDGHMVAEATGNSGIETDLSSLSAGVYIVKADNGAGKSRTAKIIVK